MKNISYSHTYSWHFFFKNGIIDKVMNISTAFIITSFKINKYILLHAQKENSYFLKGVYAQL